MMIGIETAYDANYMSGMAVCGIAGLWLLIDFAWRKSMSTATMYLWFVGLALIALPSWAANELPFPYSGLIAGLVMGVVMSLVTFSQPRNRLPMNNS